MISIDNDKCTNCSVCSYVCPHGVIVMTGQTAELVNIDKCIACGACQLNCPSRAITVIKKTGCVMLIIKEDILKIKSNEIKCEQNTCSREKNCNN
jgi:NAD-dependent dihydropyrimidine dehydrogenase PreA subunit